MNEPDLEDWCDFSFTPWHLEREPGCPAQWKLSDSDTWTEIFKFGRRARKAAANDNRRPRCIIPVEVFDADLPPRWRNELFQLIDILPEIDWLIPSRNIRSAELLALEAGWWDFPEHVWLGAAVSDQAELSHCIRALLRIPVEQRFVVFDPLLGPINLGNWIYPERSGWLRKRRPVPHISRVFVRGIAGRFLLPPQAEWISSLREQCKIAGTPFHIDNSIQIEAPSC